MNNFLCEAGTRLTATWAVLLGVAFTGGGTQRIVGPTWSGIASVPGAPATWGIPLAVLGVVALVGSLRDVRVPAVAGLYGIAVWCLAIMYGFARGVINDAHAAVTGPFTYALIAGLAILFAYAQPRESQ